MTTRKLVWATRNGILVAHMALTFSGVGPVKIVFILHTFILVSIAIHTKTTEGDHKIIVGD